MPRRTVARTVAATAHLASPRMAFGARSLLLSSVLAQVGFAVLLAPRLVRVLDNLSNNPRAIIPLVALGAVGVVLFGWAWLSRVWSVAVTFCAVAAVGWLYFFAQSF